MRMLGYIMPTILLATSAHARLDESVKQSEKRYGKPVTEGDAYPLVKGATHKVYHFEGWKISAAFLDDKACCLEYSKLRETDRKGTVVIQEDEIKSLLEAEQGGGEWTQDKQEPSSNPFTALGRFVENVEKWENSNGRTAVLKQNKLILRVETPAAKEAGKKKDSMSKF